MDAVFTFQKFQNPSNTLHYILIYGENIRKKQNIPSSLSMTTMTAITNP